MGARKPQPKWMAKLKEGDVIQAASGLQRVVRQVNMWPKHKHANRLHSVTVVIKHCSWTGKCFTCLDEAQLNGYGYKPLGVRVTMRTRLDRRIKSELARQNSPDAKVRFGPKLLGCCEVRGIR